MSRVPLSRAAIVAGVLAALAALAAIIVVVFAGATRSGAEAGPSSPSSLLAAAHAAPSSSLLLVTLDTTRADRLGCYGNLHARTPGLDALAARGVLYQRAWTAAPITLSSHATILTGVYPSAHGVRENAAFVVAPAAQLLSEVLQSAGFRTGAFVGSFILDAKFGLNQGFDVYEGVDASRAVGTQSMLERPAGAVVDGALRFADQLKPDDRFFLWVHFYDPHHPYQPPPAFATDAAHAYDGEIAYCDAELRRLLDGLRARGLDGDLLVAVTADHGESLDEHREKTHGIFVYDATMQVPLIVAPPPSGTPPGTRIDATVSNVDVAVTLLARLGLDRVAMPDAKTPPLPGVAALSESGARDLDERALYLESLTPYYSHRQHPLRAVVWKGMKYVETTRPELYSLRDDPRELRDLAGEQPELRERLAARLAGLLAEHPPLAWSSEHATSGDDAAKIRAIGYAGADPGGDPFAEADLADPKDRIGDIDLRDRIAVALRDGAALLELDGTSHPGLTAAQRAERRSAGVKTLEHGLVMVQQLRDGNPKDPMCDLLQGTLLQGLRRFSEAIPLLERVITINPRTPINHYNLARAYAETGHPEWARRELEKVVWLEPRSLFALRLLSEQAMKEQDKEGAAWWLDALARCPGIAESELASVRRKREQVGKELEAKGATPRPPAPLTDTDLLPEGGRR